MSINAVISPLSMLVFLRISIHTPNKRLTKLDLASLEMRFALMFSSLRIQVIRISLTLSIPKRRVWTF
jgi:hypothetical protein